MSTSHFFPSTEAAQIIWLTHYALQLLVNGPTCGIGNEEIILTLHQALHDLAEKLIMKH